LARLPIPEQGTVLTHFIVSGDVARSRAFYVDVLGGEAVKEGEPSIVQLANSWIIINVGGGPTEDKPEVVLEAPVDPNRVTAFLNLRVADIHALYEEWTSRGAEFLTPPMQRATEIRCFLRDPDRHLIEVGQWTTPPG
jgi:catechol 2,3-dioxygenase-like lactoylglutathione lyase family enzyme